MQLLQFKCFRRKNVYFALNTWYIDEQLKYLTVHKSALNSNKCFTTMPFFTSKYEMHELYNTILTGEWNRI